MLSEVLSVLRPAPGDTIIDGTVGEGGHALAVAASLSPGGRLIGIDKDADSLKTAENRLSKLDAEVFLCHGSYANMKNFLEPIGLKKVEGVLLDLGFSMRHIKKSGRGFSFRENNVADMRYNTQKGVPAWKWIKGAKLEEIKKVLKELGQEEESLRVAKALKKLGENKGPFSSRCLSETIYKVKKNKNLKIDPATKTFQAIRIKVNSELEELKKGLNESVKIIKKGGRLAVLTYHSLEDRIVKEFLSFYSGKCFCPPEIPVCTCGNGQRRPRLKIINSSGAKPSEKEIKINPASRSARLRAGELEEE